MPARKKTARPLRRLVRWSAFVLLGAFVASVALVLPLRFLAPATSAFMLQDDSGRVPPAYEWRDWPDLGAAAALAVVAAEDQKFGQHAGFDVESIRRAVAAHGNGARLRGASTITQQVAKNLYLWPGRSFLRKGLEAWFTVLLELCLPKRRILEIYLNIAEFAPGVYGIEAASRHFFARPAAALSASEAALLAAVLPNPRRLDAGRPSPYLRERQRWILGQMARLHREGWLTTL